ncbi:MAG TPA: response regulator [Ktedonobacteraceae bacterium]|nr:response regulator [Ktedonobacteraceae bacterium]
MPDPQQVNAQAPGVLAFSISRQEQHYAELPQAPNTPYVLIVDDDEAIVSVLLFLLESEQHAGVGLSDSKKVLPFLEQAGPQQLPSVILLDLMMPQLSGYEIAATLSKNEQYAQLPIIIMTADSRVRSASAVAGARDWVAKPFQIDALLTKLEQYLIH